MEPPRIRLGRVGARPLFARLASSEFYNLDYNGVDCKKNSTCNLACHVSFEKLKKFVVLNYQT